MTILEALQTESGLRLSIGRRWMTAENGVTFEVRTGGLRSEVIYDGSNEHEAVDALLEQGKYAKREKT